MHQSSCVTAIIVAGGKGTRFGDNCPKQYHNIGFTSVLAATLNAFLAHDQIDQIVIVIGKDDLKIALDHIHSVENPNNKPIHTTYGGETRQLSVFSGLKYVSQNLKCSYVLIHDAVRPYLQADLISRAVESCKKHQAAIPAIPVTDTIKIIDESGYVSSTPDRSTLKAVQTPQSFSFELILKAHQSAFESNLTQFTDDAALVEWFGNKVFVFEGDPNNKKITYMTDLVPMDKSHNQPKTLLTKTGIGFDVHAFTHGNHIWLGGIKIPYDKGLLAHSDGDVVLHALTDALLGTISEGDIGVLFPPSDPQWKNASSDIFLKEAATRVFLRGGIIDHLDVTILCETPKLGPYREEIKQRIADIISLHPNQVSIKASTTEKLGFTGRSEGIAAMCNVSVRLPSICYPS